jgi:hypothetical protein
MWGRVPGRVDAGGAKRRMRHRGDRSFPVRTGDVQRRERTLGVIECLTETRDVVETELDAEGLERKQPLEH